MQGQSGDSTQENATSMADLKLASDGPDDAVSLWKLNSGGATLLHMTEENSGGLTVADSRYRALLDASRAIVEQLR